MVIDEMMRNKHREEAEAHLDGKQREVGGGMSTSEDDDVDSQEGSQEREAKK